MRSKLAMVLIGAMMMLGGCYRHNLPVDTAFRAVEYRPPVLNIFVDRDGSFYPDGWRDCVQPGKRWREGSLLAQTQPTAASDRCHGQDFRDRLAEARKKLLDGNGQQPGVIPAFLAGRRRVFILIHGFNNSPVKADAGYDILERSIAFEPPSGRLPLARGDAVIRFYWDGFVASNDLSPAPLGFWFKAVKTSQLAGQYGLRPILAKLTAGQQAIVITHSRGASVLLSALSNPPYASRFVKKWEASFSGSQHPLNGPLLDIKADINAILLGPAVGHLDFCPQGTPGSNTDDTCRRGETRLRDLPGLRSLHFTVNFDDLVLRKGRPYWASRLYPTSLGANGELLGDLRRRYRDKTIVAWRVPRGHGHAFPCYASDPVLKSMLEGVQVTGRDSDLPMVDQRPSCGVKKTPR